MDDEWEQNPGNLPVMATEKGFLPIPPFSHSYRCHTCLLTHFLVAIPHQALWLHHSLSHQAATEKNQQFVPKTQPQKV